MKTLSSTSFCSGLYFLGGSLAEGLSNGLEPGNGVVPQRAPHEANKGVEECAGILQVKVGVDGDSHEGGESPDEGTLVLLGVRSAKEILILIILLNLIY